jgi:rubredoxin-NAD+ reductase
LPPQVISKQSEKGGKKMKKVCDLCGWEYNEAEGYPEGGIAPGTKWEDIPDDFVCPLCGAGKDEFSDAE